MKRHNIIAGLAALSLLWVGALEIFGAQTETLEFEEATPTLEAEAQTPAYELDTGTSKNAVFVDGPILNHIYLGDMSLSGMTREEAKSFIEKRLGEITSTFLRLQVDSELVVVPAKDLGVFCEYESALVEAVEYGKTGNVISRYKAQKELEHTPLQFALDYQVNEDILRGTLEEYCVPLNRDVKDYDLTRTNEGFQIIRGQTGISFKMEESVQLLKSYFGEKWTEKDGNVVLAVDVVQPKGSEEELSKITTILGKGSTNYASSNSNRKKNIANAVEKIKGTVLYPGETFSVSGALVPFTAENGYYSAASYANGEVVESLGGGVCQVSTTLYLAAIRAELAIPERHNHSMTVGYVKLAMDAAIAEGYKDLVIKNNLQSPIYLHGYADGSTLYFAVYGEEYRPDNRKVTFESEMLEELEPATQLTADKTLAFGTIKKTQSSHTGYRSQLWKVITVNGEETRELMNKSNYRTSPEKYSIGIDTTDKDAAAALRKAIATNDLDKVQEVIDTYKNAEKPNTNSDKNNNGNDDESE